MTEMERNEANAPAPEAGQQTLLDQLVEMTALQEEEKEPLREAFEYILEQFAAMPDADRLRADVIDFLIAELDAQLSQQVTAIMHHPKFQAVEASWRGLQFLVQRTDFDSNITIDIIQATKQDLLDDLRNADSLDQSFVYRKIYTNEFDQVGGGRPFGALIGDYFFDSTSPDIELLSLLSDVAQAAHAPFISSVGPSFFKVNDWQELLGIPNLKQYMEGREFAEWKGLREKRSSIYLGLTMSRFLLRQPYGPGGETVKDFNYTEQTTEHEDYLWGNPVFAYASRIHGSFADAGWVTQISGGKNSGGLVPDLKVVDYMLDGEKVRVPTEVLFSLAWEKELSDCGFIPLCGFRNENQAAFVGNQSVHKPEKYDTDEATANAALEARLAYLFPICRVAHYLKRIRVDNIGTIATAAEIESDLKRWLQQYYAAKATTPEQRAKYPFAAYDVKVVEDPANPGWYTMDVWVQPRIMSEGGEVKLHLVSKLPNKQ